MLRMYYFRYHAKPTTNNPDVLALAGAVANVFVDIAEPVAAESRARQYLIGQHWEVLSLDQTGEVRDEREFAHDELLVDLHRQAKECGIACLMVAYPVSGDAQSGATSADLMPEDNLSDRVSLNVKPKGELTEAELDRRATLLTNKFAGINPPSEAFYIRSILYSASRARNAFERFAEVRSTAVQDQDQVSLIHEALGHAASLSRFFWPSKLGGRKTKVLTSLKEARAARLRQSFELGENSHLKNRKLRDFLEHFDERLDQYLLRNDSGYFFPDAMIGEATLADDPSGHIFKLVDPTALCFVLLGEKHFFEGIREEVFRIYDRAREFDSKGCKLPRPAKT
jgi:hypothetical protein